MSWKSSCLILTTVLDFSVLISAVSSTGGPAGLNIFDNYCNRIFTQLIKNQSIWIDGGLQSFTQWQKNNSLLSYTALGSSIGPRFNGTNPYMIQVPIHASWDWKENITETAINMSDPNPSTGTSAPQVYQGALFGGQSTESTIWLYGGTYSWLAKDFSWFLYPDSQHNSLWSYDTASNTWAQYDVSDVAMYRPSHGYAAEASDQNLGFYLNGKIDNGSSGETAGMGDQVVFIEGMIVLDLVTQTARNISTTSDSHRQPRVGGRAHYVPGYGGYGIIAFIGGGQKSASDRSSDAFGSLLPMDEILMFDISKLYSDTPNATDAAWYTQTATGSIPEPRSDFCVVGIPAPDNSSYTIYLYGGRNQSTAFDDIYALSLPAFVWSQVYFQGASPRYGHDCQLVTGRQMITIGGARYEQLDKCDWLVKGVGVYDISQNQWGSVYDDSLTNYTIPALVVAAVGGSPLGGANVTSPASGWTSPSLASIFSQKADDIQIDNTTSKQSRMSGGAIAGIAVGILAFLSMCAGTMCFFIVRRRRLRTEIASPETGTTEPDAIEADATSTAVHEKEADDMNEADGDYKHACELDGGASASPLAELPGVEMELEPKAVIGQK